MASVNRPISPHIQIYKPQLTSVLSITHRMTGIVLSLGSLLLCYWLLTIASGEVLYTEFLIHSDSWYGNVILMSFVFSYFYHFCNGIRHLFWDASMGLEIESAYKSGYAVIVASVFLTGATYYLARVVT